MTDLRRAAEMALQYFENAHGLEEEEVEIKEALRQALDDKPWVKSYCGGKPNYCTPEVPCKTDPRAPHGFDRNASHSADRYVCECEGWEPVDNVYMSEERVHKTDKSVHEWVGLTVKEVLELLPSSKWKAEETLLFVQRIEDELKHKNSL
jgi:hypothetical protein